MHGKTVERSGLTSQTVAHPTGTDRCNALIKRSQCALLNSINDKPHPVKDLLLFHLGMSCKGSKTSDDSTNVHR